MTVPRLNIEVARLHTAALAMVGKTTLSGAQKKISVNISADRQTLQVATGRGFYILKPPTESYPHLPENEHITLLCFLPLEMQVEFKNYIADRTADLDP